MKNGVFWDFTLVLKLATRRNIPEDTIRQPEELLETVFCAVQL
jgi:hypothetical protein